MIQKLTKIHDVARKAGVSTATVSRALSHPELLSEATRDAVQEAIRITGYRANQAARSLRRQRAGAVLVLVPGLGNPFFSKILAGISAGFADSDYSVLVVDTAERSIGGSELSGYFLGSIVDGMISLDGRLTQSDLAALNDADVNGRVVFACEWVHEAGFPSVRSDNEEGARLVVRHLSSLGHGAIAHVAGPEGNVLTHARLEGFLKECGSLGIQLRDEWIISGDFSLQCGRVVARRIQQMEERPTAVFCASDMIAFGLISGLVEGGLNVPGDISVVGFDDIEMSQCYIPSLTTVRQDRWRLGRCAATHLLERLSHPGAMAPVAGIEVVGVELSIRDSTASA